MAPLALVLNLTTRELHLNWFQIWPPDGANCTGYKFYHQIAPLALLANLAPVTLFVNFATRWHFLHWFEIWQPGWLDESHATLPWIALLALSVSIDLVSSSAGVTSVKFQKGQWVSENRTHRTDQWYLGPIKNRVAVKSASCSDIKSSSLFYWSPSFYLQLKYEPQVKSNRLFISLHTAAEGAHLTGANARFWRKSS